MKKILRTTGILLALALVIGVAALRIFGFEPRDGRPGLWLAGELHTEPVSDWKFTNQFPEIFVQTNSRYIVPHSVTAWCAEHNGNFYLFSSYRGGGNFPDKRLWNQNVLRDPRVRLKIGDRLFDRTVRYIDDESVKAPVYQAFVEKYPHWRSPGLENVHIFLVEPTG